MNYLPYLGYAALVVFFVYRQFTTGKVSGVNLLLMPGLIAFGAVSAFSKSGFAPSAVSVSLLVLNGVIGIAFGVWRGQTFAIWSDGGAVLRRGTWMTLWNWLALIASRVVLGGAATLVGLAPSSMIGDLLISLFLTFAAQNLVIWLRGQAAAQPALGMAVR